MRTALVTGTSGYLGGKIAAWLEVKGWQVKRIAGRKDFAMNVTRAFSEGARPELVIHAGFHVDFRYDPQGADSANVANTKLLINATGGAHFIFLSAAAVLGVSQNPLATRDEGDLGASDPDFEFWLGSRYVREKLHCEALLSDPGAATLDSTVLYLTTTYGPGMQANVRESLARFASPWRLVNPVPPGGTSYLDLDDFLRALETVIEKRLTGRFVVSSGNIRYRDLVKTVRAASGTQVPSLVLPLPGFLFQIFRKLLFRKPENHPDTVLLSSFGYKYYSPQRLIRAASWRPRAQIGDSLARALASPRVDV